MPGVKDLAVLRWIGAQEEIQTTHWPLPSTQAEADQARSAQESIFCLYFQELTQVEVSCFFLKEETYSVVL